MRHRHVKGLNRLLVREVARLLAQPPATHPDFMSEVVETMRIHGYDIEFVQRGIRGTYVRVVRCPIKKEEGDEESSD